MEEEQQKIKILRKQWQIILNTLLAFLEIKRRAEQHPINFNHDPSAKIGRVLPVSEEYKLSIMECMKNLAASITSDLILEIYVKENASRFCQMLYVALEIAKTERMRQLRVSAIECILSIARVLNDDDFNDKFINEKVADVFLYFLPGIASGFKKIALEDETVGHKVPMVAIIGWGKIITLLMAHYGPPDEPFSIQSYKEKIPKEKDNIMKTKLKNPTDIKDYLSTNARTPQWYKENDWRLKVLVVEFLQLTHHSHYKVRLALVDTCDLVIEHCYRNIPFTIGHLIEIVITLSSDENNDVLNKSRNILTNLTNKFSADQFKVLLENLEERFMASINGLPRKFNGIDEKEKLTALNLIVGYINLFGQYKLNDFLLSSVHLHKLLETLIHVSELEKSNISLLEEYVSEDVDSTLNLKTPWKNFRYFKEDVIQDKLEELCTLLSKHGAFNLISDFLIDTFMYSPEQRKEAIFLLNSTLLGSEDSDEHKCILKNILLLYTSKKYWNIPIQACVDEYGYKCTLPQVQNNVITICLLIEGLGKIALVSKENFKDHLLRTLYLVFERAGSGNQLVKIAGVSTLKTISLSCKYASITELIIKNIDYFSYYVERNLNKNDESECALNVLSVILKYSTIEVLPYTSEIIKKVLIQSGDKNKDKYSTAYLQVFNIFIQSLISWFNVTFKILPIKSKIEKEEEYEDFYVSGLAKEQNLSDERMEKSAEEMYKEDNEKKEEEEERIEEYKKPEPPLHIKLTVEILGRSLHFLPSKSQSKKLLVLKILTNGLEIIKDWEDELLPIVHQIWSPLVGRFQEFKEPLIINYSFRLLMTLARLSKDFIRMRTQKEVLPSVLDVLLRLSKESYLKDKGSAYRFTQSFKLQLTLLQDLATLLLYLDVADTYYTESINAVFPYLSDKQPIPLQERANEFYLTLWKYDQDLLKSTFENWKEKHKLNEFAKNVTYLCSSLE